MNYMNNLMLHIYHMKFPEDYLMHHPGFPSLMTNYDSNKEFFYSAHIGSTVIMILEWRYNGFKKLSILLYVFLAYMVIAFLVWRANYTIDIFTGISLALYLDVIYEKYSK